MENIRGGMQIVIFAAAEQLAEGGGVIWMVFHSPRMHISLRNGSTYVLSVVIHGSTLQLFG